ncbi:MAG TPA: hypothetical protein VFU05_20810 [Cyclobacteriaceae bacterium]|nr:hypothetical protein [Cyclobacteriaceae bacterium]
MKGFVLIVAALLLSGPELAVYKNDAFHFEVQIPKVHQEESNTLEEKFGSIEFVKITGQEAVQDGEVKGNLTYTVIASRYQTNDAFKRTGMKFQDFIYNHAKTITEESFISNNFIILAEKHSKDLHYYFVGDGSMETFMHKKIVVRNDITYSMSIMSKKGPLPQENIDSFFKSLKISTK